jgi:hypothetical protein
MVINEPASSTMGALGRRGLRRIARAVSRPVQQVTRAAARPVRQVTRAVARPVQSVARTVARPVRQVARAHVKVAKKVVGAHKRVLSKAGQVAKKVAPAAAIVGAAMYAPQLLPAAANLFQRKPSAAEPAELLPPEPAPEIAPAASAPLPALPTEPSGMAPADAAAAPLTPDEAKRQFADWLQTYEPAAVDAISTERPSLLSDAAGLAGFDDELGDWSLDDAGSLGGWVDDIVGIASKVIPAVQQVRTVRLQARRAAQGLAPLPTPQAQAVAQTTAAPAPRGAGVSMPLMLAAGGLGLAAIFLMSGRRGGRR